MPKVERIAWRRGEPAGPDSLIDREWIVTNGLGGYASGTAAGLVTRRYHGLLVAALPNPLGRTMMLNQLQEDVHVTGGERFRLGVLETPGALDLAGAQHLEEFRLEMGLPIWRYRIGDTLLEKRIFFAHLQNTVYVSYRLVGPGSVRLSLRPAVDFRLHEAPVGPRDGSSYQLRLTDSRFEIRGNQMFPSLRMRLSASSSTFVYEPTRQPNLLFRVEAARGYESVGDVWSPGHFELDVSAAHPATLLASTEPWETCDAMRAVDAERYELERRARLTELVTEGARDDVGAELALAADQFLIVPAGRVTDATRARAQGEELRTVIAGYHWFTDWGRDTMISLEGLTLVSGRTAEARWILHTFQHYVREGLIPNMFPEGAHDGLYHTADATLWFFHAVGRYLAYTDDRATLRSLLPTLEEIVAWHRRGTRFGIHVDERDGLLAQGSPHHPLTWMDAKCGDWIVTPRRGKPVEINALWYNALSLLAQWLSEERGEAAGAELRGLASRVHESFNARFWYEPGGHLHDLVDAESGGPDPALRPNQILAVSLPHPVLVKERWAKVVDAVAKGLLTPVGLRSLAPGHPDYKPNYHGDLRTRDGAYHQGTVWSWLIGPFVDAFLKVHPGERRRAREFLQGLVIHLGEAGIGSVSEIFDAEPPFVPRGCIAQAWGVAELLRAWQVTKGAP
jgi:predicted glycogen debranching enzyme